MTAVWVGFDKPSETLGNNAFGATTAGPIWHDFMAAALATRPNLKFIPPPGVTLAAWDSGTGQVTDAFKPGQTPGGSAPSIGRPAAPGAGNDPRPPKPAAGGVDSDLGGLY